MPLAVVVLLVHMGILLICFHLIISPWILHSSGVRHLTTTQETWVQIPGGTFSNGEKNVAGNSKHGALVAQEHACSNLVRIAEKVYCFFQGLVVGRFTATT